MSAALTFHVPPDADPKAVMAIFNVLTVDGDAPIPSATLKERVGEMLGKQPRGEALALARDLGLVQQQQGGLLLTAGGRMVATSREPCDLIHGLSYFAWSDAAPTQVSRLWTYRTVVDLLWELSPTTLDAPLKKRLVEDLLGRAEVVFAAAPNFSTARASVGPKSVDGVVRWIEGLTPPVVMRERRLERRQRCPPSLMVLAVSAAALRAGAEIGTDFRLGAEERDMLCRACLLEPTALDAMLEWTVQTQPHRLRWGTPNARYGRQLVVLDSGPLA